MLPDRVSNPGPLTYESGALPIALRGPMKKNIKKVPVKFREDLLYFQHFMPIFVFVPNY